MTVAHTIGRMGASNRPGSSCYARPMDANAKAIAGAAWLAAMLSLLGPVRAEKRASVGIGMGVLSGPTDASAGGDGPLVATSLGAAYEADASLRTAWHAGLDIGGAWGKEPWTSVALDAGISYRLDILAWVPYVRGTVGLSASAYAHEALFSPIATAALGIVRLRDRDASWRGELRYRMIWDAAAAAPRGHEAMVWVARSWHWAYF